MSDPESPSKQPRQGHTGPTSPNGKARSSENAITHGCRSAKLILRHENPAEFEALRDAWFRHYQPETEIATALVEETVRAHWLLKRAQKHLENIAWELPATRKGVFGVAWTADRHAHAILIHLTRPRAERLAGGRITAHVARVLSRRIFVRNGVSFYSAGVFFTTTGSPEKSVGAPAE